MEYLEMETWTLQLQGILTSKSVLKSFKDGMQGTGSWKVGIVTTTDFGNQKCSFAKRKEK